MPYNTEFYKMYDEYLHEPTVRKAHDWIFDIIKFNSCFEYTVDLGCGLGEFKRYTRPRAYLGLDKNFEGVNVKKIDYRNCDLKQVLGGFKPLSFVSLFSSEITATVKENYELYERIFKEIRVKAALVAGFYYYGKINESIVQENGGLTSYQTIEPIESVISDVFTEKRVVLPVPSKLFGPDVYEVWKILEER
jgi:hypothetical protein